VTDPDSRCLHDMVTAQAARTPDAVAVVAGHVAVTFAELSYRANQLARHLRELGVDTDTPVAVCAERGIEMVVALLGIQVAGGAYLPLDPDHPADRLGFMIDDVGAPVLVAPARLAARIPSGRARPCRVDIDRPRIASHPGTPLTAHATPDSLAYVIYTSGSTGRPKGVCVPHRGIVNRIAWMQDQYRLDASDVVLQKTPYGFDVSVWEFFWPLSTGARLVVAEPGGHRDPGHLADMIATHGVTTLHFVPTMLAEFLAFGGAPAPTTVRRVFCSGEALPGALAERAAARFGADIHNLYGPTEASVDVSYHRFRPADRGAGVSIGAPIAGTTMHVMDPAMRELPVGALGELYLGGVGLARGYHGRAALTAERFVPDPFGGGRLYRTGDLARRLPNGEYDFVGRADHQVKIRGNRIELGEIELALLDLDGVSAAVVVVHRLASGHERLVAYVAATTADAVHVPMAARSHLAARLPDYMVPAQVVVLDRLPVTVSGKIDRRALPEPPAPASHAGAEPRTPAEIQLATLWRDVLAVDRVGLDDDFFVAGGDSILAIRLVARARGAGLALTVRDVFAHPTVAGLAARALPVAANPEPVGVAASVPFGDRRLNADELARLRARWPEIEDVYPLTPPQEGMLFHWLLNPADGDYLQHHVYRLDGAVDVTALAAAWRHTIGRHPALRTTVVWEGVNAPVQAVHAGLAPEVRIVGTAVDAVLADDRRTGFDLAAAPPIRVTLCPRGDTRTDMVLTYHHILLDGWSVAGVLAEVMAGHQARIVGGDLPDPPIEPFRRFVSWLDAHDPPGARAHWRAVLDGAPAAPPPAPDAVGTEPVAGQAVRELPVSLVNALTEQATAHRLTLHTVFAGAWAAVLAHQERRRDVVFGVTVAGRPPELPGVESIVGLLVNTIPLRVRLDDRAPYRDLLRVVQEQQLASREFEHSSLGEIMRAVGRPAGRPLFDSVFVFQNHPPLPRAGPRLTAVRVVESTGYPLTVVVELDGTPRLRLLHQRPVIGPDVARRRLEELHRVLAYWAAEPDAATGAVLGTLAGDAVGGTAR
jgi:amino acid adenylation domain-containing protein